MSNNLIKNMLYNKKKCIICGKEFEPIPQQRKTCSDLCSKERKRQKENEYKTIHCNELQKKRKAKQRAKIKPIFCKICGEVVERYYSGIRVSAKTYHEYCVVDKALKAIKNGAKCTDKDVICARNVFGYTVTELRCILNKEV